MTYNDINKKRLQNKKSRRQYVARERAKDPIGWNAKQNALLLERRRKKPERDLLWRSRSNAKTKGLEHTLTIDDIVIPEICPVLGIPLVPNVGKGGKRSYNAPSVDRIDCSKGYTKDNIRVISWRANDLIANGTLEEFRKVVSFLESHS